VTAAKFLTFLRKTTTRNFQRDYLTFIKACSAPGTVEANSRSCHTSYFTCLPQGVAGVPSAADIDSDRSNAYDRFLLRSGDEVWRIRVISKNGQVDDVECARPPPAMPAGAQRLRGRCTGVPIQCGISFCGQGCFSNPERGSRGCIGNPLPCAGRTMVDCFDGCMWFEDPL